MVSKQISLPFIAETPMKGWEIVLLIVIKTTILKSYKYITKIRKEK